MINDRPMSSLEVSVFLYALEPLNCRGRIKEAIHPVMIVVEARLKATEGRQHVRRFMMVLGVGAIVATVVTVSVVPVLTQTSEGGNDRLIAQADDKAAKKAARQTRKAARQV